MIDWAATGDMLTGVGTILGAFALLLAAYVGRNTVRDLRATKVTERRFELAEDIAENAQLLVQNCNLVVWLTRISEKDQQFSNESERSLNAILSDLSPDLTSSQIGDALVTCRSKREELARSKPLASIHLGERAIQIIDSIIKRAILIETAVSLGRDGKAAQLARENVFTSEASDQLELTYFQLVDALKPHLSD